MWVYVIYFNYGRQGFGPPLVSKLTLGDAKEWLLKYDKSLNSKYPYTLLNEDKHLMYYMNMDDPLLFEGYIIEGLKIT